VSRVFEVFLPAEIELVRYLQFEGSDRNRTATDVGVDGILGDSLSGGVTVGAYRFRRPGARPSRAVPELRRGPISTTGRPVSGTIVAAPRRVAMADDSETVVVERLSPDEAFDVLAHETRYRVLRALLDADRPLSFSDLRTRVGADDPGGFNYHLQKLVGRFVTEPDDEDGYQLTVAGKKVVGGVLSGGYTKALRGDSVDVDAACIDCGGSMEVRFEEDRVIVTCRGCGLDFTNFDISPGVLEGWSRADAPAVVDRWLKRVHDTAEYGFCPTCDGRVDRQVYAATSPDAPDWVREEDDLEAVVHYDCARCTMSWNTVVPLAVLVHPALVAHHYEHGIDLRRTPYWALDWLDSGLASVVDDDPLRVEVPVTLDGDRRTFTFDADLDLVEEV
jgi:hypothetical protein